MLNFASILKALLRGFAQTPEPMPASSIPTDQEPSPELQALIPLIQAGAEGDRQAQLAVLVQLLRNELQLLVSAQTPPPLLQMHAKIVQYVEHLLIQEAYLQSQGAGIVDPSNRFLGN